MQIKNTSKGKMGFDFSTDMEYTVCGDGSILVNSIIIPSVNGEIIPRIGYKMILPEGFERMRWYGRGPLENYSDRKDASFVGFYDDLVSNQRVDYLTPQEMGGHEDVRWIAVTNSDGLGFAFVAGDNMAASALHINAQDMVDGNDFNKFIHPYEVPVLKETVFCLDAKHRPLGNGSCGPDPMDKYELRSEPTTFSFMMLPLNRNYSNEELAEKTRVQMPVCMPVSY